MTATPVSEISQAFSVSAFDAGLLGSRFGSCVSKGLQSRSAEHLTSKTSLPTAQTSAWTMKRPARGGMGTCLLSHCCYLFPSVSTSQAAAKL